jgi:plasmid maintenance system antidote protein VapI
VNAHLREALERSGWKNRELARELAKLDMPEPTHQAIEKERRNVTRWLAGTSISDAQAERLAVVFDVAPDTFKTRIEVSNEELMNDVARLLHSVERVQGEVSELLARLAERPSR